MDVRLRSVLNLALHPSTGEGEAQAALNRARSMVAKSGFDNLFGKELTPVVKEKIVYRDRPNWTTKGKITVKVSSRWQFSMIERLLVDAPIAGVEVFLESCESQNKTIDSGATITIIVCGTKNSVKKYDDMITEYIEQANSRNDNSAATNSMIINPVAKKKILDYISWSGDYIIYVGLALGFLIGQLFARL